MPLTRDNVSQQVPSNPAHRSGHRAGLVASGCVLYPSFCTLNRSTKKSSEKHGRWWGIAINWRSRAITLLPNFTESPCCWCAVLAASYAVLQCLPPSRWTAEGCGSRKLFRCGYHGWTYGLDGSLISAPEFEGQHDFCSDRFALTPVRVEQWFNLIFVNLDADAEPLVKSLGILPKQVERFNFAGMKLFQRRTYEMKCNWKTYVDNYLEGYHLPSVHPGLNRELDYGAYTVEPFARHVRQFSPIRGAQPGDATPRRYEEAREDLTTDYFWIFPNWMLNCYPDNVSLNIVLPLGTDRSRAIFEWYLPEEALDSKTAKTRSSSAIRSRLKMLRFARRYRRTCIHAATSVGDTA